MWRIFITGMLALTVLSGCTRMAASDYEARPVDGSVMPIGGQPAVVQALQRQVRERDRRIAELTFQLEALKRIEQDAEARRHKGRFAGPSER